MFGLGAPELIIILVIALLIFGPKRLPEVGANLGKAIREFKQTADDLKSEVTNTTGLDEKSREELKSALTLEDVRKDIEDVGKDIKASVTLEEPKPQSKEEVKS